jgi:transposase-like protein
MMAERGILLTHTTILRWVQRYVPDFEKRWQAYARPVGDSWRVDETYIKVKGQWVYLYRAVDKAGRTVDFLLSRRRDMAAAKRFFSRATKQHGTPRVITLDGYVQSATQVMITSSANQRWQKSGDGGDRLGAMPQALAPQGIKGQRRIHPNDRARWHVEC